MTTFSSEFSRRNNQTQIQCKKPHWLHSWFKSGGQNCSLSKIAVKFVRCCCCCCFSYFPVPLPLCAIGHQPPYKFTKLKEFKKHRGSSNAYMLSAQCIAWCKVVPLDHIRRNSHHTAISMCIIISMFPLFKSYCCGNPTNSFCRRFSSQQPTNQTNTFVSKCILNAWWNEKKEREKN